MRQIHDYWPLMMRGRIHHSRTEGGTHRKNDRRLIPATAIVPAIAACMLHPACAMHRSKTKSEITKQNARRRNRQSWSGKYGKRSECAVDHGMGLDSGRASPMSEPPIKSAEMKNGRQLSRAESDDLALDQDRCDEMLVVVGFRPTGIGWKIWRARLAMLQAARDACGLM